MDGFRLIALVVLGAFAGILAGLLGIGGGTVMVPILLTLGYEPIQAVATSSLAIIVTALSGSIQNWRMGYLEPDRVLLLGLPTLVTGPLGVIIADSLPPSILLIGFAALLSLNIFLVDVRRRLAERAAATGAVPFTLPPAAARGLIGSLAGLLAGMFGVGGGVIMVPLQMALLGEPIKRAIQTSLGVVVIASISATAGHTIRGNVVWVAGLILGLGGLVSAQLSTRLLPKLSDRLVSRLFRGLLSALIVYTLWQALQQ